MTIAVHHADCVQWLAGYAGPLFDACVTDPPYHLLSTVKRFANVPRTESTMPKAGPYARASRGFMGKKWDGGDVAFRPETWAAVLAALKPGAHLVAFSGTRTYHRMACAIEDVGFEIRDQLAWAYGSGFPKSHDMSKAIDRHLEVDREVVGHERLSNDIRGGALLDVAHGGGRRAFERDVTIATSKEARRWQGWGTALKPAWEPICLARKPCAEPSVAANLLAHGTGAVNVDGCRVEHGETLAVPLANPANRKGVVGSDLGISRATAEDFHAAQRASIERTNNLGRWPANLLHDGSPEVLAGFPDDIPASARAGRTGNSSRTHMASMADDGQPFGFMDSGSAARFFYSPKAGPLDRLGSAHATVKPVDLMRWLCRLVTPPGGMVLDPFAGSGTTAIACLAEGFDCTLVELEAEHVADIERKLAHLRGEGRTRIEEHLRPRQAKPASAGALFDAIEDAA